MTAQNPAAVELLRQVVEEQPGNAAARWRLGALLYDLGEFAAAECEFRAAVRLDPQDDHSRRMLRSITERLSRERS